MRGVWSLAWLTLARLTSGRGGLCGEAGEVVSEAYDGTASLSMAACTVMGIT